MVDTIIKLEKIMISMTIRPKNVSIHNLEKGGENMNQTMYNEILLKLRKFGIVDVADFSIHYLRWFLNDSPQLHDLQKLVDEKAVKLSNLDTWE